MKMLRQKKGKWVLACVAVLVMLMPVLAACPPPQPEMPTIRVGIIGPMKFLSGEHTWWGAEIAANEINAAGGVNVGGVMHEIELIKTDDNSMLSIPDAVSAMERIITVDRVHFVIGGFRSEAVLAQQEVMADHGVIFINTGSAHPEQTMRLAKNFERYRYFFRVSPVNSRYLGRVAFVILDMAARAVREQVGIEIPRVAVVAEKAVWADPIVAAAAAMLPRMGMELVGTWRPSPLAPDVTAELTAIKDAGAHIIFQFTASPVGVVLSKRWGELRIPAALVGISGEGMGGVHWEATGGMCEYEMTMSTLGRVMITDKTIPFYDKFVDKHEQFPIWTAGSYEAVHILKEAIERAGTIETYAVLEELQKTDHYGAAGRIVFYPPGHETPHDVRWGPGYVTAVGIQWMRGEPVVVWPDGWEGINYEGTVDYKLPPWMVEYWKGR